MDRKLDQLLPSSEEEPRVLHESMRYSVFAGGKRLRPILAIAAYEVVGGKDDRILEPACGLELIHTYSLIHDDLPCMDDDDLRRGQPTNHKVFGEAIAVLAGDALTALAFECFLGKGIEEQFPSSVVLTMVKRMAEAAGSRGLVGGQVMDITHFSKDGNLATLERTCQRKTGSLIEASVECGAVLGGANSSAVSALREYGRALGLAFQITDDILNVTGDATKMGKAIKTDASRDKTTFPQLLGLEGARAEARRWSAKAQKAVEFLGDVAWMLQELPPYVIQRQS